MKSIRTKMLIGFGLLLTALLSLLGAVLYLQVKATVIPLTQELSQEVLNARSAGIGHLFQGYQNDIRTLSHDPRLQSGNLGVIEQELKQRKASISKDYEMLFFSDANGDYVSSIGSLGNVKDRAYWKAIMLDGVNEVIGEPVVSRATGATVFVVAAVVTNQQGQRIGMVAATVLLDTLSKIAGAIGIGNRGFGWVMDSQGWLIAHPKSELRMQLNLLRSSKQGYQGLEEIGRQLAQGKSGLSQYQRPDGTRFVTIYNPIPHSPNWGLGVSLHETELMGRAFRLMHLVLWGMAGILGMVLLLVYVVSGRIAAPIRQLMQGVRVVSSGNLEHRLDVRTGDEIQALAEAFNHMTDDLKEHIRDLARVSAEKARVDGELHAATQIQASMLPHIFPPYPEIANIDLFAIMEPAKEVGGDFYDFFLVDNRHLCVCIGDVSGKGVPAALFMVIGMTILKNLTQQGLSLSQVFTQANNMLCSDNGMFITAFMAILDIESGELEYVSAGHNPPLIAHQGADFSFLNTPIHLFLGGMENQEYRSSRIKLAAGDVLFVYTDGLTEAMNAEGAFYTNARMLDSINRQQGQNVQGIISGMRQAVRDFVQNAPAADDLTMLALTLSKLTPPARQ